jgi:uncharacterized membrane protein
MPDQNQVNFSKILKFTINCLFLFIIFLILSGGLFLRTSNEISQINPFVLLLWVLIAIYFVFSKFSTTPIAPRDLIPFRGTELLIKKCEDSEPRILWKSGLILSSLFALIFIVCSIFKYYSFNAYMWDLGFFDNLLWNTSVGRFYKVGTVFKPYESVLGDHIHPIILVFLPFYKIYPTPVWFLFFQPIIVAAGALGVFRLALAILKDKSISFLFLLGYLMYLPLRRGILFDFHESSFFPCVYLWMFAYYFEGKHRKSLLLFLLSFAIKETAALFNSVLLLSIALFGGGSKQRKILFATLAAFSLAFFLVEIQIIIPYFRGGTQYEYAEIYKTIGRTPFGIIQFVFTEPVAFLKHVAQKNKFLFLFKVLAPLAFLTVCSLRGSIIVAIPLIVLILSNDPRRYDPLFPYHYGFDFTAFVFLSAILGLQHLRTRFPAIKKRFAFFVILWMSLALYDKSDVWRLRTFRPSKEDIELHRFLKEIPKEKSIRATTNFVPHFSQRNNFQEAVPLGAAPGEEDYYIIPKLFLNKPEVSAGIKEKRYRLLKETRKVVIFVKE